MLSLIKETSPGGPTRCQLGGYVNFLVGLWVGFCLHIQINLAEEYFGQKYFYFTPTDFAFHLFFSGHQGEKVLYCYFHIYEIYMLTDTFY